MKNEVLKGPERREDARRCGLRLTRMDTCRDFESLTILPAKGKGEHIYIGFGKPKFDNLRKDGQRRELRKVRCR